MSTAPTTSIPDSYSALCQINVCKQLFSSLLYNFNSKILSLEKSNELLLALRPSLQYVLVCEWWDQCGFFFI